MRCTPTLHERALRAVAIAALCSLAACGDAVPPTRAVYLLLDTSGTYTREVDKANAIANYLLATLHSGDSMGLARIDSGSFSEKDIVARVTFDPRPSRANEQKREFRRRLDQFVSTIQPSAHTDITGALLQASEWLSETGAGHRYILVFSDLEEDLREGYVRDFGLDLQGISVLALNVTKLRSDQIDPREYRQRLSQWEKRVRDGGGSWRLVNDLERLDGILPL